MRYPVCFRAKFGAEICGTTTQASIFSISKSEITKMRATKKFDKNKSTKKERRRKGVRSKKLEAKPEDNKVNLDHRHYGAWYLHPSKWVEGTLFVAVLPCFWTWDLA